MTTAVRSICPFCSMGCSLRIGTRENGTYVGESGVPILDYDVDGPFNRGSLCGKGSMSLELCTHPQRFESPRIRTGGSPAHDVGWDAAMAAVSERLVAICRESGSRAVGIYLGPHVTDQEAVAAVEFARVLGTPNLDGGAPEDQAFLGGVERSGARSESVATIEEIEAMTAMLCVGDVFSVAPCVSRAILGARYDRRNNLLGTLSASRNRTMWFGRPVLRCRPSGKIAALALMLRAAIEDLGVEREWVSAAREVLAGLSPDDLEESAGLKRAEIADLVAALVHEERSGVFAGAIFGDTARPDVAAGLAALLADATGSRFLALPQGSNAIGVRRALTAAGFPGRLGLTGPEMFEAAVTGDLRALVVFGIDPLAAFPGSLARTAWERLDFRVAIAALPGEFTERADVVLASCVYGEKTGSVTNAFGASLELGAALGPPGVARAELEILEDLIARVRPYAPYAAEQPVEQHRGEQTGDATREFLSDVDLYFRLRRRTARAHEVGSHVLVPRGSASHAGDGSFTRLLSWPLHERPRAEALLSEKHAKSLGVVDGDAVLLRSAVGEARLTVRVESRVPESVVFAPSHDPSIRHLMRWRMDPGLRNLDLRPSRVSVEPVTAEVEG